MTKSQISSGIIIIILALILADNAYAQEKNRTESRLNQVKRTKIIEELNLNAPEKEKFIETFDQAEAKMMAERDKKHDIFKALQKAIAENKSDETIAKLSDELQVAQNSMHAAMSERLNSFKNILSKRQFGMFILVDHKFMKDVQKSMMNYYKNCNHSGNKEDCSNANSNLKQNNKKKKNDEECQNFKSSSMSSKKKRYQEHKEREREKEKREKERMKEKQKRSKKKDKDTIYAD